MLKCVGIAREGKFVHCHLTDVYKYVNKYLVIGELYSLEVDLCREHKQTLEIDNETWYFQLLQAGRHSDNDTYRW